MPTTEKVARHPFHETIVDAIKLSFGTDGFLCLKCLIETTKIPKGHDEIVAAADNKWGAIRDPGRVR